ncbi:MAG: organic solvent ABC transporter ATP-binding protein [Elioraea sp.]|nr:organic solvent ABC transporter ATP-binding protein [Elioraea sp.]MDW8445259.1 organic solvent ABC transporter ATP-binding protein [Acetobacteraceae bacterium]
MSVAHPILQFEGATLPIEPAGGATLPLDFAVAAADLVLIDLVEPRRAFAFADAVAGLVPPSAGRVLFEGRDWQAMPHSVAEGLRGRIGRAFHDDLWLPFLTVTENIVLRPAYHTRSSPAGLVTEASRLCRLLGLPGVPAGYPSEATGEDLRRAGLARAFLGSPRLVVLEHPTERLGPGMLGPILRLARTVRDEGGAVLWLLFGEARTVSASVPATRRLRLIGSRFVPVGRVAA